MAHDHLSESELLDLHAAPASMAQRKALEAHVARCAECRERLADVGWLDATLAEWPAPDPPRDGLARVMRGIADRPPVGGRPFDLRAAAATLTGVLLGAGSIAFGGARLSATSLVAQLSLSPPLADLAGVGLASLAFFGLGSLVTLALAPMLLLEVQSGPGCTPALSGVDGGAQTRT